MRFVIQRVGRASVSVDEKIVANINCGLLVLVGISDSDDENIARRMVKKLVSMRIFADDDGKTNLNLQAVSGALLLVPQFTLYADCRKGNRPSFFAAGKPDYSEKLFKYVVSVCKESVPVVETGIFGANMKVDLENDGPFTIILDSDELKI